MKLTVSNGASSTPVHFQVMHSWQPVPPPPGSGFAGAGKGLTISIGNEPALLYLYKDADAQQAHRDAVHFKELGARLGPYMAGRPEVEVLDAV